MEFKKKLKSRLYIGIIYIVLGLTMIAGTFISKLNNDFISSFGFALVIMGFVRIRNYKIITKNEENIRKQEISETDERTISIIHKARSTTFSIYVLFSCIVVIILSFLKMHELAQYISLSVLILILIYYICYFIYQKTL